MPVLWFGPYEQGGGVRVLKGLKERLKLRPQPSAAGRGIGTLRAGARPQQGKALSHPGRARRVPAVCWPYPPPHSPRLHPRPALTLARALQAIKAAPRARLARLLPRWYRSSFSGTGEYEGRAPAPPVTFPVFSSGPAELSWAPRTKKAARRSDPRVGLLWVRGRG